MTFYSINRYIHYFHICKVWLTSYIMTQIVIMAVSLPFLIAWGIPFSGASIIGNLLFTPFITVFLLLSSIFFLCTLFGYTPHYILHLLEISANIWVTLLQKSSEHWMIAIPYSSPLLIAIASLFLVYLSVTTGWHHLYASPLTLIRYSLLFGTTLCLICKLLQPTYAQTIEQKILIMPLNTSTCTLYDSGFFSTTASPINAAHYTIKQQLTQKYGLPSITTYYCNKINKRTLQGLTALCSITPIQKIVLPPLKKSRKELLPKDFWKTYYTLRNKASEEGTIIQHQKSVLKTVATAFGSAPLQITA